MIVTGHPSSACDEFRPSLEPFPALLIIELNPGPSQRQPRKQREAIAAQAPVKKVTIAPDTATTSAKKITNTAAPTRPTSQRAGW